MPLSASPGWPDVRVTAMGSPSFDEFVERCRDAAKQWMHGNPEPWAELWSRTEAVTAFEAWGGTEKGWGVIGPSYVSMSQRNRSGTISFETLQRHVTPEMAFTVELVRGRIRGDAAANGTAFELRVTSIFRTEDGRWKFVHRHVDPMVKPQT